MNKYQMGAGEENESMDDHKGMGKGGSMTTGGSG